ncbi:MAG: dockerin type I repeat-containing protein [Ruminococcus sp.]|nr:dockerin type I repeat-containing protein [Ruminococcus sp.]
MKMKVRLLSVVLAVLLLFSAISFTVSAENKTVVSGTVYENYEERICVRGAEVESVNLMEINAWFELSDGTYEPWNALHDYPVAGNDVEWGFVSDDSGKVLEKDGKATLWISCADVRLEVEYTVLDNPVESFELDADFVFYENYQDVFFDPELGYYVYCYDFDMEDTVTVHFTDGTSTTDEAMFYFDDFGCNVELYDNQREKPWKAGEENYITARYMGHELKIPVEIIPVPVESIEVTKLPDKTEYEEGYYPLWQGMEVTLGLIDGSEVVATIDEDELEYDHYLSEYTYKVGEFELKLDFWDEYTVTCFDKEAVIEGLTFTEARPVADMEIKKISRTGVGTVVDIEYESGEKETLTFDVVDTWGEVHYGDDVDGRIRTDRGYLNYVVTTVIDEDGVFAGYELCISDFIAFAGEDKVIPETYVALYGDVNESGVVDIKDATLIQKHLAGIAELSGIALEAANVVTDRDVNIKDATAIQKWVAGLKVWAIISSPVSWD